MCYTKGEFSIKSNEIGLKDAFKDEVKVIWIIPKAVFNGITKPKKEYGMELHEWSKDRVVAVGYKYTNCAYTQIGYNKT